MQNKQSPEQDRETFEINIGIIERAIKFFWGSISKKHKKLTARGKSLDFFRFFSVTGESLAKIFILSTVYKTEDGNEKYFYLPGREAMRLVVCGMILMLVVFNVEIKKIHEDIDTYIKEHDKTIKELQKKFQEVLLRLVDEERMYDKYKAKGKSL